MFILIKSGLELYVGHMGSKTRSLGQIIEQPCVDNRGHSFHPIFMKFKHTISTVSRLNDNILLFINLCYPYSICNLYTKYKQIKRLRRLSALSRVSLFIYGQFNINNTCLFLSLLNKSVFGQEYTDYSYH